MFKKLTLTLILASFNFGCIEISENVQNNQNLQNVSISKKQKTEPAKFLFDAVDLLGKKPSQIDEILVNQIFSRENQNQTQRSNPIGDGTSMRRSFQFSLMKTQETVSRRV